MSAEEINAETVEELLDAARRLVSVEASLLWAYRLLFAGVVGIAVAAGTVAVADLSS